MRVLPKPPLNQPREMRSNIALIASILGSVALTFFAAALCYVMWLGGWPVETSEMRIAILGRALMLALTGSLLVLITLGFAINRRTIKVGKDGFEASGGDDDDDEEELPPPPQAELPDGEAAR